jgi:carbonic anhydrase
MRRIMRILLFAIFVIANAYNVNAENKQLIQKDIIELVNDIFTHNNEYVKQTGYQYFKRFIAKQNPRATVVKCSDSRVQTAAFDNNDATNDLFVIRNIGNQIETAKGSIEYGVRHLHTPVLLIVGHSNCGAIKAASEDFSHESVSIHKELSSLRLNTKDLNHAIIENVHHQVEVAEEMFADLVKEGKLIILGTIYDFRDDFKKGYGRLILINLNGEKDPNVLKLSPYLKEPRNISIGIID